MLGGIGIFPDKNDIAVTIENRSSNYMLIAFALGFSVFSVISLCMIADFFLSNGEHIPSNEWVARTSYTLTTISTYSMSLRVIRSMWELVIFLGIMLSTVLFIYKGMITGEFRWKSAMINVFTQIGMYLAVMEFIPFVGRFSSNLQGEFMDLINLHTFNQTMYLNSFGHMTLLAEFFLYGVITLTLIGIGIIKIYRLISLLILAVTLPFLCMFETTRASLLWGKFISEGVKFLMDSIIGVLLITSATASILNEWNFVYILSGFMIADMTMTVIQRATAKFDVLKPNSNKREVDSNEKSNEEKTQGN